MPSALRFFIVQRIVEKKKKPSVAGATDGFSQKTTFKYCTYDN